MLWSVDAPGITTLDVNGSGNVVSIDGLGHFDLSTQEPTLSTSSRPTDRLPLPPDLYYLFRDEGTEALGAAVHADETFVTAIMTVTDGVWTPIADACRRPEEVPFWFEGGLGTVWLEDGQAVVAELVPIDGAPLDDTGTPR